MDLKNLVPADIDIKVLGTGCSKCNALEKAIQEAVKKTGANASITKVEDLAEIMRFGVMTTPALVINGKVVVKGKVPTIEELSELLQK